MYCPECEAEIPDRSKYCLQCGSRLFVDNDAERIPNEPETSIQSAGLDQKNLAPAYRREILADEFLFQEPSIESPIAAQVTKGDDPSIIDEEDEFYHVKMETGEQQGTVGYVAMWVVTPPEDVEQPVSKLSTTAGTRSRRMKIRDTETTLGKSMTLIYTGNGGDLLWLGLGWLILTAITAGIYYPWAISNFCRYVAEHTGIETDPEIRTGR